MTNLSNSSSSSQLSIEHVCKCYDEHDAVRDVSLTISQGERVALIGHNGAGKTTLFRMILGLTSVSSGIIDLFGAAPGSTQARLTTGFLAESVSFHTVLTGREQMHHFARLKGEPISKADNLLERVGLADAADRKIRTYSKGMRQRVGLAQALLGHPKLVLLDEPTSGLDPISRHEFYGFVDELAAGGAAVLHSSHALTELEARTDRIAIMGKGQLLADADLSTLRMQAQLPLTIRVTTSQGQNDAVAKTLDGKSINGASVLLTCPEGVKMERLSQITSLGDSVKDVEVIPASLEDLYRYYSSANQEARNV
jgi:Cu-processing system ATP-binding protein